MYVKTFAILEFVYDLITKSGLPARKAAERVLIHCFQCNAFVSQKTKQKNPKRNEGRPIITP